MPDHWSSTLTRLAPNLLAVKSSGALGLTPIPSWLHRPAFTLMKAFALMPRFPTASKRRERSVVMGGRGRESLLV